MQNMKKLLEAPAFNVEDSNPVFLSDEAGGTSRFEFDLSWRS